MYFVYNYLGNVIKGFYMRKNINFDATIQSFFNDAIAWLKNRPIRLRDGVYKEAVSISYLMMVQQDPKKNTINNAVYANCENLDGFIEHSVDKNCNLSVDNNLYLAVIRVLDAMGQYYTNDCQKTQLELLKNIKQFHIALNRDNVFKATMQKIRTPYYFAQKQK